jgi:hypothetical protein
MQDLSFVGRKLTKKKPDVERHFESFVEKPGLHKTSKLDVETKNTPFRYNLGQWDFLNEELGYQAKGMEQTGAVLGFDPSDMSSKIEHFMKTDLKTDNMSLGRDAVNRNASRGSQAIHFDKYIDLSHFSIETIISKYQEQYCSKY